MYINNQQFAFDESTISGNLNIKNCARVLELYEKIDGEIKYTVIGGRDDSNRLILKLSIYGIINTLCQNCLENISLNIEHYSTPVIFTDESAMDTALFDDNEVDDAILADSEFNILEFLEDELILIIPIAPRHVDCVTRVVENNTTNPFHLLKNIVN